MQAIALQVLALARVSKVAFFALVVLGHAVLLHVLLWCKIVLREILWVR
jgi:hypothetical protein